MLYFQSNFTEMCSYLETICVVSQPDKRDEGFTVQFKYTNSLFFRDIEFYSHIITIIQSESKYQGIMQYRSWTFSVPGKSVP